MNNESVVPFGWFWFESEENKSPYTQITGYTYERFSTMKPDGSAKIDEGSLIPLYRHPVKELTQQEIDKIENRVYLKTIGKGRPIGIYGQELVRAILRKAQEK
jgi:hypothetical protein